MSIPSLEKPVWEAYRQKFGEEFACLKCRKITHEKRENCPSCGGAMCVRITSN